MPLHPGHKFFHQNIKELTQGEVGTARQKAIKTLAKKHSISEKEARFKQALVIAYKKAQGK